MLKIVLAADFLKELGSLMTVLFRPKCDCDNLYTNTNKEKSRPFFSKMPLAFRLITQDPLHA